MARETKVGLLIGLGVILLVGIIISDHLAVTQPRAAQAAADQAITGFAQQAQNGIHPTPPTPAPENASARKSSETTSQGAGKTSEGAEEASGGGGTPRLLESDRFVEPQLTDPADRLPDTQAAQVPATLAHNTTAPTAWRRAAQPPRDSVLAPSAALTQALGRTEKNTHADTKPPSDLTAAAPHRAPGAELIHYVETHDTLAQLAATYYGDSAYQGSIAAVNRGALAADGSLIPGTRLIIPNRSGHIPPPTPTPGNTTASAPENAGHESELLATGMFDAVPDINARGDAPNTVLPIAAAAAANAQPAATVEVLAGDSLSRLAQRHLGSANRYQELYEANTDQLQSPDHVVVGMMLKLPNTTPAPGRSAPASGLAHATKPAPPARAAAKTYTVQAGDNLSRIAEKTLGSRDRWQELYDANTDRLDSPDRVTIGLELRLPS